jgi:uncharacterized membrane protein YfcA
MYFPISGVSVNPLIPPLVAFVISSLSASAGLSGAYLLLPFQVSVLGFVGPGVSPTNLLYNIVAIPGGVYRYLREGRMVWPIAAVTIAGTVPGLLVGAVFRIKYLPDPRSFKLFVGAVLLYLGGRILYELSVRYRRAHAAIAERERRFGERLSACRDERGRVCLPAEARVKTRTFTLRRIEYEFWGETFGFSPAVLFAISLVVGLVGGVYGIGGGAIIAPVLVTMMGLPIYTVAGATLLGTFVTSIVGVGYFELLSLTPMAAGQAVRPDWALGALFGVGGLAGTYVGARMQKFPPERWIRLLLGLLLTGLALAYVAQYFGS